MCVIIACTLILSTVSVTNNRIYSYDPGKAYGGELTEALSESLSESLSPGGGATAARAAADGETGATPALLSGSVPVVLLMCVTVT